MSVVNETTLLWLSSKEENDRNCVTLERFGMALLILELFYQRLFSLGESNDIDMLASKSYTEGYNFPFFKTLGTQSQLL